MPRLLSERRDLAVFVAAGVIAALLFSAPIADIDLWWHLSNGRWIWDQRSLPVTDPFGVYPEVNFWARTILQGQWAGQVALFLTHEAWDAWGVVVLRAACLAATLALVARRLWLGDASLMPRALALAATAAILAGFAADRPQFFSFLFFALLLLCLEAAKRRDRTPWVVWPVLVVWANFHPGVILGAAVAAAWLALDAWRLRASGERRDAWLNALVALGALASPLATPNGSRGIAYLIWLEFEPAKQRISEYASPFRYLADIPQVPHLLAYFAFAAVLLFVIGQQMRKRPGECVLHALVLAASLSTYRYIPFMALFSAPFVAEHFPGREGGERLRRSLAWGVAALLAVPLASELVIRARLGGSAVAEQTMPVRLVEQARQWKASGRVFTSVSWGGYIGWQFAGRAQAYIDGRYLMNTERLDAYTHILWMTPRGRMLFEQARFDWVILPYRNAIARDAQVYPVIAMLQADPRWELRASDGLGVVFSRRLGRRAD